MNHHHDHEPQASLSFEEKLPRLLAHWVKHNDDHARTYRNWSLQARENQHPEIATLLEEAAELTARISARFETAAGQLQP